MPVKPIKDFPLSQNLFKAVDEMYERIKLGQQNVDEMSTNPALKMMAIDGYSDEQKKADMKGLKILKSLADKARNLITARVEAGLPNPEPDAISKMQQEEQAFDDLFNNSRVIREKAMAWFDLFHAIKEIAKSDKKIDLQELVLSIAVNRLNKQNRGR